MRTLAQPCLTLCAPMDGSPPGFRVIEKARQDGAMDLKPGSTGKVGVGCREGLPDKGK